MKSLSLPLSLLFVACLSLLPPCAMAGKIYIFKDADGNVLMTNRVDEGSKPLGSDFRKFSRLEKITRYEDSNIHSYGDWGKNERAARYNAHAFDDIIRTAALTYRVDDGLVKAVIHTESGFNPKALSKPGAQGLMQLMPATARRYGVRNAFNPSENINGGTRHLKYLIERYQNNLKLVLAAYNAGEGNVTKYNGIPPYRETQDYVKRVLSRYKNLYGGRYVAAD